MTDIDRFGLVGARLDGKYEVHAVVAEGGFGVVYRGVHVALGKPVAIKVLKTPEHLDTTLRLRHLETFVQEARLIAGLDHPAIVRVLDFGACVLPIGESAPWMVLEWLEGTTLEHVLDGRRGAGGIPPRQALALLRPVIEALAEGHAAGIAHRDLKPGNLMVVRGRDGMPSLRLLDFGIAKVMGDEATRRASGATATQSQLRAFSLPYAAPEQIGGTRSGPWTDVHALGLIVTELLTDQPPFSGEEATELYAAVLATARPTPARWGVDVGAWELVLARAVAFRPADRYPDARHLLHALEAEVPERPSAVEIAEAPTEPRVSAPRVAQTTLRPAEIVTSPATPRSTRRAAVAVAIGGPLLAFAAASAVRSMRPQPTPTRASVVVQSTHVVDAAVRIVAPAVTARIEPPIAVVDAGAGAVAPPSPRSASRRTAHTQRIRVPRDSDPPRSTSPFIPAE